MNFSYTVELTFEQKEQDILFGKPLSNQYQAITNLDAAGQSTHLPDEEINSVLIIPYAHPTISFDWSGRAVKKEIEPTLTLADYKEDVSRYLKPNSFINGEDPEIQKRAAEIMGERGSLFEIIQSLYAHTLEKLVYGDPIDGLYSYTQVLQSKKTDCGGFSTYLGSLLQSQKIPVRLVSGFFVNTTRKQTILSPFRQLKQPKITFDSLAMHAWLEALLPDGSWFPLDAATEWRRTHELSKRKGGFGKTAGDRFVTSYGADYSLIIKDKEYKIDLLQHPFYL